MHRLVRLMVIKARSGGWGYETLVREASDSLHLRRFCRIALTERVPDESTIRKLVRRLGCEVIEEIVMAVVAGAVNAPAERRFTVRAARIDSTVVESDVRYPTDLDLCQDATGCWRRGSTGPRARGRWRSEGARPVGFGRWPLRRLNRTLAARTGQGKELAARLTGEAAS
jgi:hypothetical protein